MTIFTKDANTHLAFKAQNVSNRLFWPIVVGAAAAAALALNRLVDIDNSSQGTNPEWVAEWAVVWVCAAVSSMPILMPLALNWLSQLRDRSEQDLHSALMKMSPNMRQEMMAMASRDHGDQPLSAQDTQAVQDALDPLGGLTVGPASVRNKLETAYGLAKRPLLGYL